MNERSFPGESGAAAKPSSFLLSIVIVARDLENEIASILERLIASLASWSPQFELIVVDNGSSDGTLARLKELTALERLPDIQVYALQRTVDRDVAAWAGVENSLGDFVAVIEPGDEAVDTLRRLVEAARSGVDVVFAIDGTSRSHRVVYAGLERVFRALFVRFNGIDVSREAPYTRLVNRRVINFILQFPMPVQRYRFLSVSGGFSRSYLTLTGERKERERSLLEALDRGARLLASTTRAPLRLVTLLCAFGAAANVAYTLYVIAIAIFKTSVAPGWITLSLQQSGMFFLISLVLLVLGEYVVHVASLSSEGPAYLITQEFRSAASFRDRALNIEDSGSAGRGARTHPEMNSQVS